MKAAIVRSFGAPSCIEIVSKWDIPKIEEKGQILVNVRSAGVNPVDTYIRSGSYGVLPELPYIPGRDGSGIVEQVEESVTNFKKGDKVWFLTEKHGSTAEFTVTKKVFPLPENIKSKAKRLSFADLSFSDGACLGVPYLTAYRALFLKGQLKSKSKILIHGASGGVGLAACQLASWKGHSVVGTAGTNEGMLKVAKNGAVHVYNHQDADYLEKMKTKYKEFDLIIEMAAHKNLASDMTLLAKNGRIGVVGNRGEIQINPRLLMTMESSIFGVSLASSTDEEYEQMAKDIWKMFDKTMFRPVVHKRYSFDDISQAHVDIMSSAGAQGNLVIDMCEE